MTLVGIREISLSYRTIPNAVAIGAIIDCNKVDTLIGTRWILPWVVSTTDLVVLKYAVVVALVGVSSMCKWL